MGNEVTFGAGTVPAKERWPFAQLKPGKYFQCDDVSQHTAIRTAASRAQKKWGRKFSVRKLTVGKGEEAHAVIRVFLK